MISLKRKLDREKTAQYQFKVAAGIAGNRVVGRKLEQDCLHKKKQIYMIRYFISSVKSLIYDR